MDVRRLAVEFYFLFLLTSLSPPATLAGDGYSVEFEMEDTGRGIYGRYSVVKEGGRRVGLLFGANRHSAALKTLNGEVLIAPLRNLRGGACRVVQVASERFVDCWRKKGAGRFRAVKGQDYGHIRKVKNIDHLLEDEEESRDAFNEAMGKVLESEEVQLLPGLVRRMVRSGYRGPHHQPSLQILLLAHRLTNLLKEKAMESESQITDENQPFEDNDDEILVQSDNPYSNFETVVAQYSEAEMAKCKSDKSCPPCKHLECTGLCGPGCTCWQFLCGDCCVHIGCLGHDICCAKYGPSSWQCIMIVNFQCNKNFPC